jgi:hypothetical protein
MKNEIKKCLYDEITVQNSILILIFIKKKYECSFQ